LRILARKTRKGDPNADIRIDEPVGNSDVKQVVEENPNQIFTAVEQLRFSRVAMPDLVNTCQRTSVTLLLQGKTTFRDV
jgi:hypothetical protein